jgi:hypothetical protein
VPGRVRLAAPDRPNGLPYSHVTWPRALYFRRRTARRAWPSPSLPPPTRERPRPPPTRQVQQSMGRLIRTLTSLLPLIFAILALIFSLLSTTSREWALRRTFDPLAPRQDWAVPIYTKYRSPFIICGPTPLATDPAPNTTEADSAGSTLTCMRFRVFGFNQTSCELAVATQNSSLAQSGDARLCQQLHFAGNLAIASTTFIGVGLILTLMMASAAVALTTGSIKNENSGAFVAGSRPHYQYHPSHDKISLFTPYVNLFLITSFVAGAILYVLAQFYGVIGLVQSQPDNGGFATSQDYNPGPLGSNHEPWVQGKALTVYASIAWLASLLAAGSATLAWKLPRGDKVF